MKRPVIAVVDDEEAVRVALLYLFLADGLHALTFDSGSEYLAFAESCPPDCVVLDLQMPALTGWDILKRARQKKEAPPVITISGCFEPNLTRHVLAAGSLAHFQKPFDGDMLISVVRSILQPTRAKAMIYHTSQPYS